LLLPACRIAWCGKNGPDVNILRNSSPRQILAGRGEHFDLFQKWSIRVVLV
jgi:hypothetical protein